MAAPDYSLLVLTRFECGDERYHWLNNLVTVGVGERWPTGPTYRVFEIG